MIRALFLSLNQMRRRRTMLIAVKAAALTLLAIILLAVAGWAALRAAGDAYGYRPGAGESTLAAILIVTVLGWLLPRTVAMAVIGLFADSVVEDVERHYYPAVAARARPPGAGRGAMLGLASAGRALLVNLLMLPAYVGLFFTGIGVPVLAVVVNGLLLGKDLEAMVLARHRDDAGVRPLGRGTRWTFGMIVAVLFLVPFLNLLAPLFGAAMAVHLVHRARDGL